MLAGIVAAGLLSRVAHTGFRILDKYPGDSLYAAMVYVLFRLTGRIAHVAVCAAVAMAAIEFFQLTRVPADMLTSPHLVVRVCARLLPRRKAHTAWAALRRRRPWPACRSRPAIPDASAVSICKAFCPSMAASSLLTGTSLSLAAAGATCSKRPAGRWASDDC